MTLAISQPVGPVAQSALADVQAALAALRASNCYQQYLKNGTLPKTKLGLCESYLLSAISKL